MPKRYGKCTNFGGCPIADSYKIIEVNEGDDFFCPAPPEGCGLPLHPNDPKSNSIEFSSRNKKLKKILIIVGTVVVMGLAALLIINKIRNDTMAKAASLIISRMSVKKDTTSTAPLKNGNTPVVPNHVKPRTVDTSYVPPTLTPRVLVTLNNLEHSFIRLSSESLSNEEKNSIKKGILKLFVNTQAEVIQVNSDQATPTGMTIGKYVESISITHKIVTIDHKQLQNGKISEIYVSEK